MLLVAIFVFLRKTRKAERPSTWLLRFNGSFVCGFVWVLSELWPCSPLSCRLLAFRSGTGHLVSSPSVIFYRFHHLSAHLIFFFVRNTFIRKNSVFVLVFIGLRHSSCTFITFAFHHSHDFHSFSPFPSRLVTIFSSLFFCSIMLLPFHNFPSFSATFIIFSYNMNL